ncbi:hypothetical protein H114_32459, partial [Streptomyces gancidicus BKS 13-15]
MASSTDRPDRAPRAGSGAARRPSAGPVRLRTGVWLRAVVLLVLAALAAFAGCGTGSGTGARDDPAATGGTAREHPSATAPA